MPDELLWLLWFDEKSISNLHFECTESRLNLGKDYLKMAKRNIVQTCKYVLQFKT